MIKINNKYGTLFLITGLPGSGKTTLAKKILKKIQMLFGPTLLINGDDIRNIFGLKKYSVVERKKVDKIYDSLIKFIIKQKINLIFTTIYLSWSNQGIKANKFFSNTIRIHIKANYKTRYKFKKRIYRLKKNVPGKNFKILNPKNIDIIVNNNLDKKIEKLEKEFWNRLKKKVIF